MIAKISSGFRRFEVLALIAVALVLALGSRQLAWASDGSCVDACVNSFGVTFEANGYFYVLNDCGTSELGTGRVWCRYVGTRVL